MPKVVRDHNQSDDGVLRGVQFAAPPSGEWIELFGDKLFRSAMVKLRDRSVAEDIVQDTLVSAIKSVSGFKGEAPFERWLHQILNNKIIDYFRSVTKERRVFTSTEEDSDSVAGMGSLGFWNTYVPNWGRDPESALNDEQFLAVLQQCIDKLPEQQRVVFLLKSLKDMSAEEICKVTGVSASNTWVTVHRARLSLRQCVEKNWVKRQ